MFQKLIFFQTFSEFLIKNATHIHIFHSPLHSISLPASPPLPHLLSILLLSSYLSGSASFYFLLPPTFGAINIQISLTLIKSETNISYFTLICFHNKFRLLYYFVNKKIIQYYYSTTTSLLFLTKQLGFTYHQRSRYNFLF